jgi:hypothetical protein
MTGSGRCSPISSPTGIAIELAPGRMTLEGRKDSWTAETAVQPVARDAGSSARSDAGQSPVSHPGRGAEIELERRHVGPQQHNVTGMDAVATRAPRQTRTSGRVEARSVHPSTTDIVVLFRHVRFVPDSDGW